MYHKSLQAAQMPKSNSLPLKKHTLQTDTQRETDKGGWASAWDSLPPYPPPFLPFLLPFSLSLPPSPISLDPRRLIAVEGPGASPGSRSSVQALAEICVPLKGLLLGLAS